MYLRFLVVVGLSWLLIVFGVGFCGGTCMSDLDP